jgi:hypothetical protein
MREKKVKILPKNEILTQEHALYPEKGDLREISPVRCGNGSFTLESRRKFKAAISVNSLDKRK